METVVALIIIGGILLAVETILPGLVAGTLGLLCLVAAAVIAFARFGTQTGAITVFAIFVVLAVGAVAYIKYFPTSRVADVFISKTSIGTLGVEQAELIGKTGVAQSNLRPSGLALIGGKRVDVVTEGPMIERGTPVKVVAVEGMRVVVRSA
jgi:membrane-bound ClpP family serine protease